MSASEAGMRYEAGPEFRRLNREKRGLAFKVPYNQSLHKLRLKREGDIRWFPSYDEKWGAISLRTHVW